MKTFKSLLFFLMFTNVIYSQERQRLHSWPPVYLKSNSATNFVLYLETLEYPQAINTSNYKSEEAGFRIFSSEYSNFIQSLESAKQKFLEWEEVAKDNDVTTLDKSTNISFNCDSYHMKKYGEQKWTRVSPTFYFVVRKGRDGSISSKLELRATSKIRNYMTYELETVFDSPEEIDDLLSDINIEKIQKLGAKPPSKEDLFK